MRAIVVERLMDASDLVVSEHPDPEMIPGALAVDVKAAGCNFADVLLVSGRYQVQPPLPFVPGTEISGVVTEVGEGVEGFEVGDSVFASVGIGGYAEKAVVPAELCHKLATGMTFEEGAAFPMIYPTSYAALVFRASLQPGENLLVHAAAGGVGLAAVQIGKALGASVIATAGGQEKCEIALREGADHAIDYRAEDFVSRVKELTDGRGADVIYDSVGGDTTDKSLKCIAWNGRLLIIGFASGPIPEIKANRILLKNIAVTGLNWDAYAFKDPEKVPETFSSLLEMYEKGSVKPVIYDSFSLEDVPAALAALHSRKTWGKVIIKP